jgi:hypothetical protein
MLYGTSYEGNARECESCGHHTNVHSLCDHCDKPICEACDHPAGDNDHYCSLECKQEACEHIHVRYERFHDIDDFGYNWDRETWICRDCGARINEDGDIIAPKRRAA